MTLFNNCSEKGTCRRTPGDDSDALFARAKAHDWDWNEPLDEALNGALYQVLPDVDIAIYNNGLWDVLSRELAEKVMPLLSKWVGTGRCTDAAIKLRQLLPTVRIGSRTAFGKSKLALYEEGGLSSRLRVFDFAHLTKQFKLLPFSHPRRPPTDENDKISNARERSRTLESETMHIGTLFTLCQIGTKS